MVRTGLTRVAIAVGLGAFGEVVFVAVLVCFAGAVERLGAGAVFFGAAIIKLFNHPQGNRSDHPVDEIVIPFRFVVKIHIGGLTAIDTE